MRTNYPTMMAAVVLAACYAPLVSGAQTTSIAKDVPAVIAEVHMPAVESDFSSSAQPAMSESFTVTNASAKSAQAMDSVTSTRPFSAVGIAAKVGLGGIGFEVATPLGRKVNLRGGGNFFGYSTTVNDSGTAYAGNLQLRSGTVGIDWFPFGGSFRLSGGVEMYNGNQITATATVAPGTSFTENSVTYYSSAADPVHGTASVLLGNKAGPTFSLGWGNIVPRKKGSHISVPFEFGAVYTGVPKLALSLAGTTCDVNGKNCQTIASNTSIQQNITAQQNTYQNDLNALRFYPILSIGFGYKF